MKTRSAVAEPAMVTRTYSLVQFRSVDDEKRIIEGVASTMTPDSYNDTIDPMGAEFKLPLPFLYQHNSRQPIGKVTSLKKTKDGLMMTAQIAQDIPAAPFIAEAWALIKAKLVPDLSIGFIPLEESYDRERGGYNYARVRVLEISAVTIGANQDASITNIRSADARTRTAPGSERSSVVHLNSKNSPGVSGSPKEQPMKIREQITQFEAKRAAHDARMSEIMTKAGEAGRTLEEAEQQEYDGLDVEVRKIDEHLVRLRAQEERMLKTAQPITQENSNTAEKGKELRQGSPIQVKSMLPKGIGVARMAIAMVRAGNNPYQAIEIAKQLWGDSQPEVALHLKAVVEAGDTTTSGWASQLVPAAQQMDGEFLEMLRDAIVIGRIPGLKKVPFNVAVPLQSGAGTYGWVGEGAPKPVTKPTYGSATLRFEKAAGIIVISEELARFSKPDAEVLVRDEMIKGLTSFFDTTFVGSAAAVSNVSPAGILNGKSATAATGTTAARFRYDINTIIQIMITAKQDPSKMVLLMSPGIAMSLSSMINSLGQSDFPTVNANGGNYLGIPIVVSSALGTNIILISPDQILLAEDPGVRIDVSREASIEMDSAPAGGETSPITDVSTMKSFFQNNLIGIRCEQFRTWKVARASAVEYISGAAYAPPTS